MAGDVLRVADVDRDQCVERLQRDFVAGRLEQWELEERVERALVAKTRDQLDELTSDCEGGPVRQSTTTPRRLRPWVVGVVGAVALGGFAVANVPTTSVQEQTCVATGVAAPADVDCPVPTRQQDQLMHDATEALEAADQVKALATTSTDARLVDLSQQARAAAQRAQQAESDAQLVVATAQGTVGKRDLDDAVRRAHSAAADAAPRDRGEPSRQPVTSGLRCGVSAG